MIAVIKTGGKQYVVKEGDLLMIEKIDAKQGEKVTFEPLLKADGENVNVGTPILSGNVTAEVIEQGRAAKIEVVHYKPKVRTTKRSGHRQPYTKIKIVSIA
ncbi:MAG TPA: 50S ribosomal protein L21 [Patescibacteria group bacterium]|nr:50S ribosomal protein L21 [Patescibacteria group bacterium]